jgi:diaminohydroxyphosphoribosylaminopyrimidine deaminase / 5-amino-6-(5-phosphoribosylamino)uracil reductase
MRHALALAARGLGNVAPNPAVGCVIVAKGIIVGRGWTQPGGRPHAETEAIKQAGKAASGATAYVTLEPCAHTGKTPPCADALVAAGIAHVFVAVTDPDPRTAGQGIACLRAAGITVEVGLFEAEAAHLNRGFFSKVNRGQPWVTLKLATSADGMIAWTSGTPQWITGAPSRARGHLMRARYDALISGIGTVLADDPEFTCRLPGLEDQTPLRVILDSAGRTPADGRLVKSADEGRIVIVTTDNADASVAEYAVSMGPEIDIQAVLQMLSTKFDTTSVMVECGAGLATAFLAGNHVDEVAWFKAPSILGDDGIPALKGTTIAQALAKGAFQLVDSLKLGEDVLETYVKAAY